MEKIKCQYCAGLIRKDNMGRHVKKTHTLQTGANAIENEPAQNQLVMLQLNTPLNINAESV